MAQKGKLQKKLLVCYHAGIYFIAEVLSPISVLPSFETSLANKYRNINLTGVTLP